MSGHLTRSALTANRQAFIGGSDARIIMGNDEAALLRLWREKRGEVEPRICPATSSSSSASPPRTSIDVGTKPIPARSLQTSSGRFGIQHSGGWPQRSTGGSRVAGRFSRPNSCCRGRSRRKRRRKNIWPSCSTTCGSLLLESAVLSVITGGGKWVEIKIHADPLYQHLIVTAERKFWRCVETGEPPRLFGVEPPKPRIEAVRIVDMSSSNAWAEFSAIFARTRPAYLEHEKAKAELKSLVPEDAQQAVGHGVRARRSKSGAITFELQAEDGHAAV